MDLKALYQNHVQQLQAAYEAAMAKHGLDSVVLYSGTQVKKSRFDDQDFPLRLMPHFQSWLPLDVSGCAVVVRPGQKPTLLHNVEASFWEQKPALKVDHFWDSFDVVEIKSRSGIKSRLPPKRSAFVGHKVAIGVALGFAKQDCNSKTLLAALDAARVHKTEYEIECLAEANRRAAPGHKLLGELFAESDDLSELTLHLRYLAETEQDDPDTPYKNIVALGEHAATLHHIYYSKSAGDEQSLLVDAGATYLGYQSDITRTYVRDTGGHSSVFADLVRGVDVLQKEMCARVRPGIGYEQLHNQSHELLAGVLREVGLVDGTDQELLDKGVTRAFLPHGLGHSLGLQTHDVGCATIAPQAENPFLRNTATTAVNQVFTIEPGCYFIDALLSPLRATPTGKLIKWDMVDALRPFGGVRIEDDLVVTEDGVRNLTRTVLGD